jgi:Protein of unknown function (DUF3551)
MKGKPTTTGSETVMRAPIIMLLVVAAALLSATQVGSAQSPYSYPWCAIMSGGDNSGGGAMSCYYTSWQQCMTTLSGIGRNCVASPYYHVQPTPLPMQKEIGRKKKQTTTR